MVAPGQFLERPTLIPVGAQVMEGLSHRGARTPLLLVLPPVPGEGGGMDHPVGAELAFAASAAGFPTLRFNYRGVGASQGPRSAGPGLIEDALAALELAADNAGGGPVLVASLHGSDQVALELRRLQPGRVAGLFLISPGSLLPPRWPPGAWVVVGEHANPLSRGTVAPAGVRLEVVPSAGRTFQRGLPLVGKLGVSCLIEAATTRKH